MSTPPTTDRRVERTIVDYAADWESNAQVDARFAIRLALERRTADIGAVRRALERASPRGSTALVDAVYSALRLREPGERRTAIVVSTSSISTSTPASGSASRQSQPLSMIPRTRRM